MCASSLLEILCCKTNFLHSLNVHRCLQQNGQTASVAQPDQTAASGCEVPNKATRFGKENPTESGTPILHLILTLSWPPTFRHSIWTFVLVLIHLNMLCVQLQQMAITMSASKKTDTCKKEWGNVREEADLVPWRALLAMLCFPLHALQLSLLLPA